MDIEHRIQELLSLQQKEPHSPRMEAVGRIFLNLIYEIKGLEDFSLMAVMVLKVVFGWEGALFLTEENGRGNLQADTRPKIMARLNQGERFTRLIPERFEAEGNRYSFRLTYRTDPGEAGGPLFNGPHIGILEVESGQELGEEELHYLAGYADLVALSLGHRLLALRTQQHLQFIRKLVADIGHNVIVPNIFFKAYLRRLAGKIRRLEEIQDRLLVLARESNSADQERLADLSEELANANEGVREEFEHIEKHYVNTSLFLETLLRQSHFEQGQYVLKKRPCNFRTDVIQPQVDQYRQKLKSRNIEVDLSAGGIPDEPIEAVVDVGLISQVFANLLSNAIKYTRPARGYPGERKFIAYGLSLEPNAFGPGSEGVKINLFSTGRPLTQDETLNIFEEGRRGSNVEKEKGTGHGLFFVKEVVELHGGKVGVESSEMGNNFFFILPRDK